MCMWISNRIYKIKPNNDENENKVFTKQKFKNPIKSINNINGSYLLLCFSHFPQLT